MKRLVRPKKGKKIAGVAMGIANYMKVDVVVIRLIWVFLLIPGGIPGLLPYAICWLVIPQKE